MNTGIETIGRETAMSADVWGKAFMTGGNRAEFKRLLSILAVDFRDIYTSRLQHTMNLCGAMQGGQVKMLRRDADRVSFADLLGLLSVVVTHSRLARTKVAQLSKPAFFLRVDGGAVRPAMPLIHLSGISGHALGDLPLLLAPLIHDGALRMVRDAEGNEAVLANDGFVDDGDSRRFLKF